jgi:hypothetical protein
MGSPEGGSDATAFAAGVAAEKSQQAEQAADTAAVEAGAAADVAESAAATAASAQEAVWATEDAVAALRGDLMGELDSLRNQFAQAHEEQGSDQGEQTAPAPPAKPAKPAPQADEVTADSSGEDKPPGYGAKSWFGH